MTVRLYNATSFSLLPSPEFENYSSDLGHIFTKVESTSGSVILRDDLDPDPHQVSRIVLILIFSKIFLSFLHTKGNSTEDYRQDR